MYLHLHSQYIYIAPSTTTLLLHPLSSYHLSPDSDLHSQKPYKFDSIAVVLILLLILFYFVFNQNGLHPPPPPPRITRSYHHSFISPPHPVHVTSFPTTTDIPPLASPRWKRPRPCADATDNVHKWTWSPASACPAPVVFLPCCLLNPRGNSHRPVKLLLEKKRQSKRENKTPSKPDH